MAQETFEEYDLKEWKVIYLTLYNSILKNDDLIDLKFMDDLQKYLQQKAEGIGIEPLHHETWINWLNNAKDCGVSVSLLDRSTPPMSEAKKRRTLQHV